MVGAGALSMDKLLIHGGRALRGQVDVAGAKNAALPELCAALLTDAPVTLHNVPRLQDVATMLKLIGNMGVAAEHHEDGRVVLDRPRRPQRRRRRAPRLISTRRGRAGSPAGCGR